MSSIILSTAQFHSNRRINRVESLNNIRFDKISHPQLQKNLNSLPENTTLVDYYDLLRISFTAYNQTFYLHLQPNLDLLHPQAVLYHRGEAQLIKKQDYKVYKGSVISPHFTDSIWTDTLDSNSYVPNILLTPNNKVIHGWARIMITYMNQSQPLIEGVFQYSGDLYNIKSRLNYNLVKRTEDAPSQNNANIVVYRESDTHLKRGQPNEHKCGFDNYPFNVQQESFPSNLFIGNKKRDQMRCPKSRKTADCTYVHYYKDIDHAKLQIINNFNMASAVFEETFNVVLGLINITTMEDTCPTQIKKDLSWNRPCGTNYTLGDRLSDFSLWRSKISHDKAGLWHLMTHCPTGVEVGLAWLKQACNKKVSIQHDIKGKVQYVTGAGVSAITRDEWKVIAHEISHGFGAIHDCTGEDCPCSNNKCHCCQLNKAECNNSGYFLMSPTSNYSASGFSPCSINTICNNHNSMDCLVDLDRNSLIPYKSGTCGNGIKEEGEECDTGGIATKCCDPHTCKLIGNAVCETYRDSNGNCCHKCGYRPSTYECRPSSSSCDIPEYCTGDKALCPSDDYLEDGLSCGSGDLKCASGQCTSRDAQCLARGYILNVTQACKIDENECKMSCESSNTGKCLLFSGYFIDGTSCGYEGKCVQGSCVGGLTSSDFLLWFIENQDVALPLVVSFAILLCVFCTTFFWFGWWKYCCCYDRVKGVNHNSAAPHPDDIREDITKPFMSSNISSISNSTCSSALPKDQRKEVILNDLSVGGSR
ncbi:Metallo-peptidase family M12-domain-containing protein [Pilobolus umbonatus]|nr:Metallo-peptidase family M12-domain-containing protein [Pilobolus umbonatus]